MRLNRLVQNLLDTTRLEFGAMQVKAEFCDVQDVIGTALAQLGPAVRERQINTRAPCGTGNRSCLRLLPAELRPDSVAE